MAIFGGDNDVTLTIKAKDEASAGINSVMGSVGKMAGAFALAQVSVMAAQKAFSFLSDQIGATLASFNESEKVTAQTTAVLTSTGYAAGFTTQAIKDMATALQGQTTYGDEAIQSAENLLLTFTNIGHDIFPAATQTVLDMSTALGQDLKSSAVQLGKALQDPIEGVDALRRVGVNFTQSQMDVITSLVETGKASEAQKMIIKELSVEFGGSAAAAAGTFAGQVEQLKNKFGDFREKIGAGVAPVLGNLISTLSGTFSGMFDNVNITEVAFNVFRTFAESVYRVVNALIQMGAGLAYIASRIGQVISIVGVFDKDLKKAFEDQQASIKAFADKSQESFDTFIAKNIEVSETMKQTKDESGKATAGMAAHNANFSTSAKKSIKDVTDEYKKLGEALLKVRPKKDVEDEYKKLGEALLKVRPKDESGKATAGMAAHIANFSTSAKKSIKDVEDEYKKLGEALLKVRQTGSDELAGLSKAHEESVKQSTDRINDLKKSLSELSDSYAESSADAASAFAKQQSDDARGIGEAIVEQQKKIADLRTQAGYETDPQKRINLEEQLRKEEEAYARNSEFIQSMAAQVTEAKRRDALTEFDRQIEDYKIKRTQAEQEYNDNRADAAKEYAARAAEIKLEMAQEQKKLADENTRYSVAQAAITKILADAEALRLNTTKASAEQVIKLVDAQIQKYNQLADAIQRAAQGKAAQLTMSALPVTREHGGIVPGPVGQAVPILAHGQERVIPASQSSGGMSGEGGGVTININNPSVRSDDDLNAMRQMIEDALRDVGRVHKLTTI